MNPRSPNPYFIGLKKVIALLVLMSMYALCMAQLDIVRFDRLSDEEGLPNNLFKQVIQDRDGFLWMSGADGLARYNGYEIFSFRHSNKDSFSISGNNITVIFEDSRGRLWIGVIGSGINLSDVQKVKFEYVSVFSDETKEASLVINEITEDASGNIWIASNLGLYLIRQDKNVMKAITLQEFLNQPIEGNHHLDDPISLFTDAKGKVWIGTSTGLCMYDPALGHLFTPDDFEGLPCTAITEIEVDRLGKIWVGCRNAGPRLFFNIGGTMKFKSLNAIPFQSSSRGVLFTFDLDNRIWVMTFGEQAYGFDFRDSTLFLQSSINSDISHERFFRKPFVDHSGNTWLPCEGFYIYPYPKGFRTYHHPYAFHQSNSCIYKSDDLLWLGYREKGLVSLNELTGSTDYFSTQAKHHFRIPVDHIQEVLQLRNRHFVIVGFGNISFLNADHRLVKSWPLNGTNRAAFEDSKGRLWIGGFSGIHLFSEDKGVLKTYALPEHNGDKRNFVQCIQEDRDGNIWFGTDRKGLGVLDPSSGSLRQFLPIDNDPYSIPSLSIIDMVMDKSSMLWLATDMGLVRFNPVSYEIKTYDSNDGLENDYISSVISDKNGLIWVSTHSGLSSFDPVSEHFVNYRNGNGLANISYYNRSKFCDRNGSLYFGGKNGVDYFNPAHIRSNPTAPKILIANMTLNQGRHLSAYDLKNQTGPLQLSYKDNIMDIELISLHYANQSHVRYAYKMEGLLDDWVDLKQQRNVLFSGLQPGNYTFKAKAVSSDGVWSVHEISLPIHISPPFYKAIWFRIMAFIVIVGGLMALMRFREHHIKKKEKAETEVNRKILELEKRALQAQMNPHFIYNSMNSIQQFMIVHDVEGAMKYLTRFSRILRSVLNLSSQNRIPLYDEINLIKDYLELENMRFPDKFSYTILVAPDINIHTVEIPPFFIQPQVENAIRHGLLKKPTPGHLHIEIKMDHMHLQIIVEDNGIGRDATMKEKQMKDVSRESRGLAIIEERLTHLHSNNGFKPFTIIDLYDTQNKPIGTRVEISLPIE